MARRNFHGLPGEFADLYPWYEQQRYCDQEYEIKDDSFTPQDIEEMREYLDCGIKSLKWRIDLYHSHKIVGHRAEAAAIRENLDVRLAQLKCREATLEEAYLFKQTIDRETYERQRDLLRESVALATLEAEDAKLEEIDVDGLLGFAEFILANAARLWSEATFEQNSSFSV